MRDRIKGLRKALGLTQQQFADRIGVKRNTIANYEIGRNEPVDSVVNLICREFNVSEAWLRTGEGEMFLPEPEDELDALVRRYGLSAGDRILIQRFLALPDDARQYVLDYVLGVADAVRAGADPADAVPAASLPEIPGSVLTAGTGGAQTGNDAEAAAGAELPAEVKTGLDAQYREMAQQAAVEAAMEKDGPGRSSAS